MADRERETSEDWKGGRLGHGARRKMDLGEVWGDHGGWQWDAGHKNAIRL